MKRYWKLILAVVVLVAAFVFFREPIGAGITAAAEWARGLGYLGIVVFAALYAAGTVFAIPGSALTLIAGGTFGFGGGTVAVWSGATVGMALAFLVARRFARDYVAKWLADKPSFSAVDRAVAKEGGKIVFLTRLTPIFPFSVLNYAYGMTGISFGSYLMASSVGILPGTLFYLYIGSTVAEAAMGGSESGELVLRVVGFVAFAVVTVLITRIARRALREAGVEGDRSAMLKESGAGK